jgi:hypothetical protein
MCGRVLWSGVLAREIMCSFVFVFFYLQAAAALYVISPPTTRSNEWIPNGELLVAQWRERYAGVVHQCVCVCRSCGCVVWCAEKYVHKCRHR